MDDEIHFPAALPLGLTPSPKNRESSCIKIF